MTANGDGVCVRAMRLATWPRGAFCVCDDDGAHTWAHAPHTSRPGRCVAWRVLRRRRFYAHNERTHDVQMFRYAVFEFRTPTERHTYERVRVTHSRERTTIINNNRISGVCACVCVSVRTMYLCIKHSSARAKTATRGAVAHLIVSPQQNE